jgi:hypothetical protein
MSGAVREAEERMEGAIKRRDQLLEQVSLLQNEVFCMKHASCNPLSSVGILSFAIQIRLSSFLLLSLVMCVRACSRILAFVFCYVQVSVFVRDFAGATIAEGGIDFFVLGRNGDKKRGD